MEQSCSRLYTVPLSPAAQKILAVLRAQSGHAIRLNHGYSNSNSQMVQSYHGSQRELLDQSTWRLSQRESRVEDRPWSWSQESSTSYWDSSKHWSPQTSFSHQPWQTPDCALSSQTSSSSSSSSWESSLQRHLSQTEVYYQCSQTDPKRHYPEPHAYQCSQFLPFNQHEVAETAASFCRRDRFNASPQIGYTQSIHQSTVRRNSTDEVRPSFNGILSSVDGVSDKALLPTMEDAYNHEDESSLDGATLYSCFKMCHVTVSNTSGSQKKKSTESWSIPTNEHEVTSCSDSRPKLKLPLSNTADEATSGQKGRRTLYQQPDLLTQCAIGGICLPLTVSVGRRETCCDSLRPTRNLVVQDGAGLSMTSGSVTEEGREQLSVIGDEIEDGVAWREKGDRDASLLIGKANEMISIRLPKSPGLSTSIIMGNILDCYTEGEVFWKKEEKNVEYGHIIPEIREAVDLSCSENKDISVAFNDERPTILSVSLEREDQRVSHSKAQNTEDMKHHTENLAVQPVTKLIEDDDFVYNLKGTTERGIYAVEVETGRCKKALIDIHIEDIKHQKEALFCSDIQMGEKQFETDHKEVTDLHGPDADLGESREDRDESIMPPADNDGCPSTSTSTSTEDSEECTVIMSGPDFKTPCSQQHDNLQTVHGSIRGNSSGLVLATSSTFATASNFSLAQNLASTPIKASTELETGNMLTSQTYSHNPPLKFSLLLKRKCVTLDHQPTKINPTGHSAKWEPPLRKGEKRIVNYPKRSRPKNPSLQPSAVLDIQKTTQQIWQKKVTESYSESGTNASKQSSSFMTCKQPNHKRAKSGPDQITRRPKIPPEGATDVVIKNQSKASCLTANLTSDPRVMDCWKLNLEEKMQILEQLRGGKALVLTLVHQDGTTQLDPEQKFSPAACGILILMRNNFDSSTANDSLGPNDNLIYLKLEQRPAWAQLQTEQNYELFLRDMLQQMLSGSQLVVCYKAKDFLRTALQFYRRDISWKQVAGCQIQDPQVSGWLLDPSNPSSCYQDLLSKHCKIPCVTPALGAKKVSQVISGLCSLYWLNMELCSKLQKQGLWELYSNMELKMIPVLAAMESHQIHVDKEALKRMSDLLGAKMKQLEQEAHRAAGQIFLVTSNSQLRTVLFEKLCLHERCENKKLPKTNNKQQSTSEAALLQLQDLHPLPKIILEYRQNYISSTWHQTSAVTGRISAKHPNFQALPRQPLYVTKKQYIQGKEEEVVCVHPRAMFIPQEGWSFLAADFCQVELRLLAHLSSDPVLLCHFAHPQSDIFTILASQWKDLSETEVTSEDREHAKRVVYSVVYGAGRERLSGILGVSAEQASRFQDSFLQTYKDVQPFIQRTIQQCHKKGYVLSIMGRRRTLPNISSPDWAIRMQAERQAVNFVVQGSAADLCKMAMIRIFNLVSSSSLLSARLIAQLHDELLYEVEDSQVGQFAALVKTTMESLQQIDHLGVHLKVPLRVAVSSGKSWGSMCELNILPAPPPSSL